jgi:CheY-like chemotaxis protein
MLTVLTKPSSILVVDANPLSRQLVCQLLERAGHTVTIAGDGLAALAAVRANRPDAVVIDLNLPGVPGLEAVRWLRARTDSANIPVLGLCAFSGSEQATRFLAAGCTRFFAKPIVSAQSFLAAIVGMLRREPAAPATARASNVVPLRRAS